MLHPHHRQFVAPRQSSSSWAWIGLTCHGRKLLPTVVFSRIYLTSWKCRNNRSYPSNNWWSWCRSRCRSKCRRVWKLGWTFGIGWSKSSSRLLSLRRSWAWCYIGAAAFRQRLASMSWIESWCKCWSNHGTCRRKQRAPDAVWSWLSCWSKSSFRNDKKGREHLCCVAMHVATDLEFDRSTLFPYKVTDGFLCVYRISEVMVRL